MTKAAESIEFVLPNDAPLGWRRTTLGEIGEYINGRGFKKSEWSNKGLPIIRIQNLTGNGKEQNYYNGDIDERHVVNPGDLLISWAATLGAYLWPGPRAALNQHIFKVRSFVDKKFHYYLIQHILGDLYRQTHGSGMVHITKSKFDATPVLVPETIDQQKHVVSEIEKQFSRLDEAVANLKRVKANLKRYKASVLKAAVEGRLVETEAEIARREGRDYEAGAQLLERILETRRKEWKGKGKYKEPVAPDTAELPELPNGWVWAATEQLGYVQLGRQRSPKNRSRTYPVKYLRAANITENGIDLSDVLDMEFTPDEQDRYRLQQGDIVLSEASGSPDQVGKPAVWQGELPLCCFQNTVIRLRPVIEMSPYLLTCFQAHYMNGVFSKAAGGVGINHLSLAKFSRLHVSLPPLAEQHRIVSEVDRRLSILCEAEAQVDVNLQRADRLHQSILSQVFSGQLFRHVIGFPEIRPSSAAAIGNQNTTA